MATPSPVRVNAEAIALMEAVQARILEATGAHVPKTQIIVTALRRYAEDMQVTVVKKKGPRKAPEAATMPPLDISHIEWGTPVTEGHDGAIDDDDNLWGIDHE